MILNGIRKIDDDGGDYVVLVDYGQEGLCVRHQTDSRAKAILWTLQNQGEPCAILKLVRLEDSNE